MSTVTSTGSTGTSGTFPGGSGGPGGNADASNAPGPDDSNTATATNISTRVKPEFLFFPGSFNMLKNGIGWQSSRLTRL